MKIAIYNLVPNVENNVDTIKKTWYNLLYHLNIVTDL